MIAEDSMLDGCIGLMTDKAHDETSQESAIHQGPHRSILDLLSSPVQCFKVFEDHGVCERVYSVQKAEVEARFLQ